jgi:hypothetical protein
VWRGRTSKEKDHARTSLLDCADWRIFRLFLVDLKEGERDRVSQQLQREMATGETANDAEHDRSTYR